jgi:Response regulator containing CheY-like receiver, AAA-type ATPase, and DNA-binding domains
MIHLTAGTSGRTQTPPTRVLVVDDADMLVSLIETWLEDDGYDVATATSGRQAIESLDTHDPDIVLLDLILPPPDGFTLCEVMRRRPRPPEIIVMTGLNDPMRVHEIDGPNLFALLHKPLTQETVLDVVSRARRHRWETVGKAAVQ